MVRRRNIRQVGKVTVPKVLDNLLGPQDAQIWEAIVESRIPKSLVTREERTPPVPTTDRRSCDPRVKGWFRSLATKKTSQREIVVAEYLFSMTSGNFLRLMTERVVVYRRGEQLLNELKDYRTTSVTGVQEDHPFPSSPIPPASIIQTKLQRWSDSKT